jgi:hypothetical protein
MLLLVSSPHWPYCSREGHVLDSEAQTELGASGDVGKTAIKSFIIGAGKARKGFTFARSGSSIDWGWAGMTSTKLRSESRGFWRDSFARLGVGVGAATFIGNSIYGVLTSVGIVRWQKRTTPQELMEFEKYAMYFFIIPLLASFFLMLAGAYRALRRKQIS